MFHPSGLTPKELVFLAKLMDQGSDNIARQVCEDMSDLAGDLFDTDLKVYLERPTTTGMAARTTSSLASFCPKRLARWSLRDAVSAAR